MTKKNVCFYFINSTDIQEYTGLVLEAAKRQYRISVMIFDNMTKKRNFYYYSMDEINQYFELLFSKNDVNPDFTISKYGMHDHQKYIQDYTAISPDVVFTRDVNRVKYINWKPITDSKKTVMFIWEAPESRVCHDYLMTVSRHCDGNIDFQTNSTIVAPSLLRYPSEDHEALVDTELVEFCKQEKTCFIAETWSRGLDDKKNNLPLLMDVLKSFRELGYKIAYKMREKGYPAQEQNTHNYVKEITGMVDLLITKDLNYPSSLYYMIEKCDVSCTFNVTSTALDTAYLSRNRFIFLSKHLNSHYRNKLKPGHGSWGKVYENLCEYFHLFDEKKQQLGVKQFIADRLNFPLGLVNIENKDYSHKLLMDRIESITTGA